MIAAAEANFMKNRSYPRVFVLSLLSLFLVVGCSRDPNVRKQGYLASGNKYFDQAKYREAAIEYLNAIQIDQGFPEAHYRLAQAYLRQGVWSSAYQELVKTTQLQPTNLNAQIDLGNLLLSAKQFKQAQDRAQAVLDQDSNSVEAHILMANADAVPRGCASFTS